MKTLTVYYLCVAIISSCIFSCTASSSSCSRNVFFNKSNKEIAEIIYCKAKIVQSSAGTRDGVTHDGEKKSSLWYRSSSDYQYCLKLPMATLTLLRIPMSCSLTHQMEEATLSVLSVVDLLYLSVSTPLSRTDLLEHFQAIKSFMSFNDQTSVFFVRSRFLLCYP